MTILPCYICKRNCEVNDESFVANQTEDKVLLGKNYIIKCHRCSNYGIRSDKPEVLIGELTEQQTANISYWLRHNDMPIIDSKNIDELKNLRTPTIGEKAERFILLYTKRYATPGRYISTNLNEPRLLAELGCVDREEIQYIVADYLSRTKEFLHNVNIGGDGVCGFKISPQGWAYVDSLRDLNPESRIGFVAMWFDDSVMDAYEQGIRVGIEHAGYKPLRIDFKEHNNRIDDEIIATIKRSKFLVADLTGQRGGVYFEAGYAMGLGLPVIWTCRTDELKNVHFDTRQYYFITWEEAKFDELRDKLKYRIEATIGRGNK